MKKNGVRDKRRRKGRRKEKGKTRKEVEYEREKA